MMTCLHHLHLLLIVGETLEEANQLVNISLETILQGVELINVSYSLVNWVGLQDGMLIVEARPPGIALPGVKP